MEKQALLEITLDLNYSKNEKCKFLVTFWKLILQYLLILRIHNSCVATLENTPAFLQIG